MTIQANNLSQLSPTDLDFYLKELPMSLAPPPTGGRAAQVAVLEAGGLEPAARAVSGCGARVQVEEWQCGTKRRGDAIHAHRYGCCKGCDRHVMTKIMSDHKYDERKLPPGGQLQRYWLEGPEADSTRESLVALWKSHASLVRKWLGKEYDGRAYEQHDGKRWVIRGFVCVAPNRRLPAPPLGIELKPVLPGRAFYQAQSWILTPLLDKTPQGELRGHIMVAVHSLNRLRSYGKLLRQIAERTEEKVQVDPVATPEKLVGAEIMEEKVLREGLPTPDMYSCTGVGLLENFEMPVVRASDKTQRVQLRDICPTHGPGCPKLRSYILLVSDAKDIPMEDRYETTSERRWGEMQEALKSVADYDLAMSQLLVTPSEQFADELFQRVSPTYRRLTALGPAQQGFSPVSPRLKNFCPQ
jgi:hypothetical protein